MEGVKISAWPREELGKGFTGRLRKEGFVPGVLYGPGIKDTVSIKFKSMELEKAIHGHSGSNVLLNLDIDGKDKLTVMVKSLVRHPVVDTLQHVDVINVRMDKVVTVDVPVSLTGKCEGVKLGGIMQQETRTIAVECLPADIPDNIEIDVTNLNIGDSIHVGDVTAPAGLKIVEDASHTVVLISAPAVEEEKTAEEAEAELEESFKEKGEGEEGKEEGKDGKEEKKD